MKNSKISWTSHTFNAWRGCDQVSPACDNCYAMNMAKRNPKALGEWGPDGTRIIAEPSNWLDVLRWNEAAGKLGHRHRVFVNSMSDLFEQWDGVPTFTNGLKAKPLRDKVTWGVEDGLPFEKAIPGFRADKAAKLDDIRDWVMWLVFLCQNLDFLFLTKRTGQMMKYMHRHYTGAGEKMMPGAGCYPNLWLGTTVESSSETWRLDILRTIPAAVNFISVEPMLGDLFRVDLNGIHWVICGGESAKGHNADGTPKLRPMRSIWAKELRDSCKRQGVPFFFKQWGNALPIDQRESLAPKGIAWETLEPVRFADGSEYFVLPNKDDTGNLLDGVEHHALPANTLHEVPA